MIRSFLGVKFFIIGMTGAAALLLLLAEPNSVKAITCGTGSDIAFVDIGGGQCRGFLVATTTTIFTVPTDWTSVNTIEAIGGGGGTVSDTTASAGGGGGGAYSMISNIATLTPGGSVTINVGRAGQPDIDAPTAGGDSWFNGASCAAASVCAKGGQAPISDPTAGGTGGQASEGVGDTKFNGGNGGTDNFAIAGGGGAAGPGGAGKDGGGGAESSQDDGGAGGGGAGGGSSTAGNITTTTDGAAGGVGPNNSGAGAGGTGVGAGGSGSDGGGGGGGSQVNDGGAGGDGTEWTTHGAGGGGGSAGIDTDQDGGPGGLYGGGAGGGGTSASPSLARAGEGGQGIIVITYTPASGGGGGTLSRPPNNLGLVGYWSLNEGTSTVATDFSGNGNTGNISGATWTNGKRGTALQFDGVNDQVNAGSNAVLDNLTAANITVCAWINPSSTQPDDDVRIVSKTNGSAFDSGWTFQFTNTAGASAPYTFQWRTRWTGGGTPGRWESSSAVITAAWQHMCVTYNGSSDANDPTIYRNGSSIAITETVAPSGFLVDDAGDSLRIGDVADGNRAFSGSIDEVRVYNRALTAGEIATLARAGAVRFTSNSRTLTQGSSLESGLVGHWPFDGADVGAYIYDRSGNNHHGLLFGVATSAVPAIGKLGQGGKAQNGTEEVWVFPPGNLNITSSFSIAYWVKSNTFSGFRTPIAKLGDGGYYLELDDDEVGCGFNDTGNWFAYTTNAENLATGVWYHLACVFDDSANTLKIYINSVEEMNNTGITDAPSGDVDAGVTLLSAGGTQAIDGTMDDARIYNRALTPAEIKQLYNLGKAKIVQ